MCSKAVLFYCKTIEEEIRAAVASSGKELVLDGLEFALHDFPQKLCQQLQSRVESAGDCGWILLGYGFCSNGVAGLVSQQQTIVIPRVHDCISLLLGSRAGYNREFHNHPGTFYLSKGWIRQGGDPLTSYKKYCQRYGEEKASMVIKMEYANYSRLAYIHTTGNDDDDEVRYSREVAQFLGLEFVEIQGSLRYFEKLVRGEWDDDFIVNPPGRPLEQGLFI